MTFQLPDLPYDYTALEPYVDALTIEIHYSKHHQGYTNKLNAALERYPEYFDQSIEQILKEIQQVPEEIRQAVRNNGGGYYHHNIWWEQLSPGTSQPPTGKIAEAISDTFSSFTIFQEKLNAAGMGLFGSGWAWLVKNQDGLLSISTSPNQDSPISEGLIPLLTIDVWEHAYYLKFQNRRDEFINNFWNMVNWDVVEGRYLEE